MNFHHQSKAIRNHDQEAKLFRNRAVVAFVAMIALLGVLVANLYRLEVKQVEYYKTRANDNRIQVLPIAPTRGLIYDRNGKVLANNFPVYVLQMIPEKVEDLNASLDKLGRFVSLSDVQLEKIKSHHGKRFKPVMVKNGLTEQEIAKFSVHQYELPGFSIDVDMKRDYPYGEILTHVLGYVAHMNDRDIRQLDESGALANYRATKTIGKLGIEKYYEHILHGQQGYQEVEVNSRGRVIRTIKYVPPVAGQDLVLNIDIDLQKFVFDKLDHREGSAVVLDPRDNSVLAIVSSPSYDPNLFVEGISSKAYSKLLNDPFHPLVNRATLGVYPPASTVKPFMAVAGLSEDIIAPDTVRDDHGAWHIPGSTRKSKVWRDWNRWGHGPVNVTLAIEESVDSFFYHIAYELGIDRISDWMNMFGFGRLTGIDIPEETRANMPTREWKESRYRQPWYKGDTVPIGIGQGYWTATPLQIAKATSVLVNHGQVIAPHLLKATLAHSAPFSEQKTNPIQAEGQIKGVSNQTWDIAMNAMRLVNSGSRGSGRRAFKGASYCSGGKSGTAQVFGLKKDQVYNSKELSYDLLDHGLYTAFAPCDHPRYVATVVIEHGNGGSKVGAPFVRQVFDYLDIASKDKQNWHRS
ncbi:penicillin-binding protein 2 [Vibrio sp. VPAP30]|uniref:penicillin-binding protein 2 n=1 Tax=Vibrio sp. VPAP30 TaxID=1647102 RepID=UPI000659E03A|nr:penicillin-binding protein 2 [Vibrio sp. VPAP30]KLN64855.1 penicillin-binding protein 2 [Vibrio sp. VPAP30]